MMVISCSPTRVHEGPRFTTFYESYDMYDSVDRESAIHHENIMIEIFKTQNALRHFLP